MKKSFYSLYLKRFIDFNLALLALIFLFPVLVIITFFQIILNGFPVFFTQERVGKNERIFKLVKFRTMNNKKDTFGVLLPDNKRKTFYGSFLRATSIDELPSLINILIGDMALIGPRPLLIEYLPLYNSQQKLRHIVRPGLSGLAQISGRNKLSWGEKFEFDLRYINSISFWNDFCIIFRTFIVVFNYKIIDKSSNTISKKFNGKN